ncbi:MAG: hypothetical protein AB7I42_24190 [Bradyrhizobium sp.]|uniref:hypothetical protein n=1 Tax=Bradyrhizobium sp. TaxID=376 RepID=UPI003D09FA12
MEYDLSKPEQYAAWFLSWYDRITAPIFRDSDGSVATRANISDPQLNLAYLAALTVIEGYLGKQIPLVNGNLGKDETPPA